MSQEAFKIINPSTLYDPTSNGYSHVAVVKTLRILFMWLVKAAKIPKGS